METTRRLSLTLLLVAPLIAAQNIQTPDLSLSSVSGEHLPDGTRASRPTEEEYDDQEEIGTSTTMDSVTSTMSSGTSTTMDSVTSTLSSGTSTTMDSVTSTLSSGTSTTMDSVTSTMSSGTSTTMDSVTSTMSSGTSTTMDSVTSTQHGEDEEKNVRNRRGDISSSEDMEVAEQVVFRPIFRHRQIFADRKLEEEEAVRSQSLEPATSSDQPYYPYQYNYKYYPLGAYRYQRSVDSYPDYQLQFKPSST